MSREIGLTQTVARRFLITTVWDYQQQYQIKISSNNFRYVWQWKLPTSTRISCLQIQMYLSTRSMAVNQFMSPNLQSVSHWVSEIFKKCQFSSRNSVQALINVSAGWRCKHYQNIVCSCLGFIKATLSLWIFTLSKCNLLLFLNVLPQCITFQSQSIFIVDFCQTTTIIWTWFSSLKHTLKHGYIRSSFVVFLSVSFFCW